MSVKCVHCGATIEDESLGFEDSLTCPICQGSFAPLSQELAGLNINADEFDELLQAESQSPSLDAQPPSLQPINETDEKTESLLRTYGAGQEKLQRRLSKEAAERIDRGLRIHLIATVAFTLFLFFSSLGVGSFLGALTVGAYVQESAAMTRNMKLAVDVRRQEQQQYEFFLRIAGILVVVSVVCFILGSLPLAASIAMDFLSLLGCLSFPEEKGAKLLQIIAAVFRAIAALGFVSGLTLSLLLGLSLAAALFIAAAVALLPLVVAWGCFCASLGQVGAYLDREDLVNESRKLMLMGFTTMFILLCVPIVSFALIASGDGFWLVAIVGTALTVFFFLLRQDPLAYLANFGLYLTSLKFSFAYANYLQSLREVVSRGHKPDDTPRFLRPV